MDTFELPRLASQRRVESQLRSERRDGDGRPRGKQYLVYSGRCKLFCIMRVKVDGRE